MPTLDPVIRRPRRPSPRGAVPALAALLLLALTACGTDQEPPGLVLESMTPEPAPTTVSPGPAPGPRTCFEVATAYTALTLVPLSTDEADPRYHPEQTAVSVQQLVDGMPGELRPAFEDAVAALRSAGGSVQPAELADLQRTLVPVQDWIRWHCSEPTPAEPVPAQ
ncbi:hypothetical protein ACH9EU_00370 [Kocuria sp. M1R5S2]|uniref:hypothetical protein n=1 Tax=Kocuria rhizosphaerae TaxID=3376285 RepID=UPI0037A0A6A4